MARKKITEAQEAVEVQEQTIVAPVQKEEETATVQVKATEVAGELPKNVKKLLETYKTYSALYIDAKGGVYTEGTQPNLRGDAILYQNPYYKQ